VQLLVRLFSQPKGWQTSLSLHVYHQLCITDQNLWSFLCSGTRRYKRWHSEPAIVCLGLLSALLLVWLICLGVDCESVWHQCKLLILTSIILIVSCYKENNHNPFLMSRSWDALAGWMWSSGFYILVKDVFFCIHLFSSVFVMLS